MSLVPFGFWAASGAGALSYWLATLGNSENNKGWGVATDSGNNLYALGTTLDIGAPENSLLLAKYDPFGSVQWQRTLSDSLQEEGLSVGVDSSDNVYVTGYTQSQGAGSLDLLVAKYNSSGTIQWQRILGGASNDIAYAIDFDSSDNVYVTGDTNSQGAGGADFLIAKYNSSGTIQWQRILGGSNTDSARSVKLDSSSNVYVVGQTESTGAGGADFLIAKYNSSGTIQWQRILGGAGYDAGRSVAIDSSDNVYVFGYTSSQGAGSYDFLLAKYNSSGTIQWQNVLGGSTYDFGQSVAIDSSDNVYVVGQTNSTGAGSYDLVLAKYNSSGTIQWQRILGGAGNDVGYYLTIDALDILCVIGYTASTGAGNDDFLTAHLPSDGSLTGTYVLDGVDFVYAASTLTAATSTLTAATSSLTAATSTLTAATSTLTDASASLTSHLVEL